MPNSDNPEERPRVRGLAAVAIRLIDFYENIIKTGARSSIQFHLACMLAFLAAAVVLVIPLALPLDDNFAKWIVVVVVVLVAMAVMFAVSALLWLWLRTGWQTAAVKSLSKTEDKLIPFAASHQRNGKVVKVIAKEVRFRQDRYLEKWKEILDEFADALR